MLAFEEPCVGSGGCVSLLSGHRKGQWSAVLQLYSPVYECICVHGLIEGHVLFWCDLPQIEAATTESHT